GDPQITLDQIDFRMIVLKEFINALGVKTSWIERPIFANVTPKILTPQLTLSKDNGGGLEFKGFKEYAYDKYIIFRGKEIQSINEAAKSIDEFVKEPNVKFKDQEEFIAKFVKSPQIESAQRIANVSVNPFTLGFQLRGAKSDDDVIVLETSLNPYQNGVSMNNFDASIYANTEDFLM
ncbi:17640_t:CDS:1, partial [Funneliformis geosporum]